MANILTMSEIMEYLVVNSAKDLPPEALAEVFDRLTWCLDDNGSEMLAVRDRWIQGDELSKVKTCLAMKESFPLNGGEPMFALFDGIAKRWPALAGRCAEIVANWNEAVGR